MDYFTADLHVGHEGTLKWERNARPFSDVDEMDETIVRDWNNRVTPADRVFILGDVSFRSMELTKQFLHRLNGQIFLIKGNHDSSKIIKHLPYAKVSTYDELKFEQADGTTNKIIMSHFPFLSWNRMHHGSYHLHGHSHGSLQLPDSLKDARILDVGIDNTVHMIGHWGPMSLGQVLYELRNKGAASTDHHKPQT